MNKLCSLLMIVNIIAITGIIGWERYRPEESVWHSSQYGNRSVIYGPAEIEIKGPGFLHRVSSAGSRVGAYEFKNPKGTLHILAYPDPIFLGDQPDILAETHCKFPEIDVDIKQLSSILRKHVYTTPKAVVIFTWEQE